MRHLLREYGLLTILVAAGVGVYFLYRAEAGNLLDASLDSIGFRLESMMQDPQAREYAANLLETFGDKVHNREIAPEEFERLAANILNLSRSGASLTAGEAKTLFDLALLADSMPTLLSAAKPKTNAETEDLSWERAGEHIMAAVAFEEQFANSVSDSLLKNLIWLDAKEGLKVVLDDSTRAVLQSNDPQAFARVLARLDRMNLVIRNRKPPKPPRPSGAPHPPPLPDHQTLVHLHSLRNKGYVAPVHLDSLLDKLDEEIEAHVQRALDSAKSQIEHSGR